MESELEKNANKIAEELGEKIIKILGSGDFGTAFLLESGRVLKLTFDLNEIDIAKKLSNNRNWFKYVMNYYNVGELKDVPDYKYFLLMDYVNPLSELEKATINHVYKPLLQFSKSFYKSIFSPQLLDYVLDQFSIKKIKDNYLLNLYTQSQIDKMKELAIDFIPHIQNIAKDLKLHHIEQCDFHAGNLGWNEDQSKLIIFDITRPYKPHMSFQPTPKLKKYTLYEYVKTPPPILNNRTYEIAEELGEEIEGYLGGEIYGYAFKTKSGKVLKITSDPNEANLALKLSKNKRWFRYLVNFYNVGKINPIKKVKYLDVNMYEWFILMDYVYDLTKEEKDAVDCYMMPIHFELNYYKDMLDKEEIMKHIDWMYRDDSVDWNRAKKDNRDPEKIKQLAIDFYPKILNIVKELNRQGIIAPDFHSGNVGWDKSHENLVFFDIGGDKMNYVSKYKFKETFTTEKFITRFNMFNI